MSEDDLDVITVLLHEAYAPLAQQGLRCSEGWSVRRAPYQSRGYSFVEYVRWPDVNYRSVILRKALATGNPPSQKPKA